MLAVAYKERLTLDYEKLGTSLGTVKKEWKTFKDAFVSVAEDLCGRTSGKGINRLQHYSNCTDRRRRRLGELWTKQRGKLRRKVRRGLRKEVDV